MYGYLLFCCYGIAMLCDIGILGIVLEITE